MGLRPATRKRASRINSRRTLLVVMQIRTLRMTMKRTTNRDHLKTTTTLIILMSRCTPSYLLAPSLPSTVFIGNEAGIPELTAYEKPGFKKVHYIGLHPQRKRPLTKATEVPMMDNESESMNERKGPAMLLACITGTPMRPRKGNQTVENRTFT